MEVIRNSAFRAAMGLFMAIAISGEGRANAASPEHEEYFEKHVRPILVERCQGCHGPNCGSTRRPVCSKAVKVDRPWLPVSRRKASYSIAISEQDIELRMPAREAGAPLTPAQIQVVSHWIAVGAPWPKTAEQSADTRRIAQLRHWAFQPVQRPSPPPVRDSAWPHNALDHFILAKLEGNRLQPSPAADPRTLIRRATYDLTGLPPTAEEVSAFVNDPSSDAYKKLVDRLLESRHYGEQWGRTWLDLARYSDTKGYVYGREERRFVHATLYRDWVVQAFQCGSSL